MSVMYLKKKKMYEMLASLINEKLELMKNASYKYYRGSEWLKCESDDTDYYKRYELYHYGYFISLDIFQWNEQKERYEQIDRITYKMKDEELIKEYQRTESYSKTEELRIWLENHEEIEHV